MQPYKRLRSDLKDREWDLLRPILPPPAKRGRPRHDRRTVNGILYVLSTGCRWEDIPPERYGSGKTCWYWFDRWTTSGVWNAIAGVLLMQLNRQRKINLTNTYLDASIRQNEPDPAARPQGIRAGSL